MEEPSRMIQPRLIPSLRSWMLTIQCSVTLHSRLQMPLIEFNLTPTQLHRPSQSIPLSKASLLLQVLGCKRWQSQEKATQTLLLLRYLSPKFTKNGDTLVDQGGNSYSMNALMISGCTSLGHGLFKPAVNGETNTPYLLQSSLALSYDKENIPSKSKIIGEINPPYLLYIITF